MTDPVLVTIAQGWFYTDDNVPDEGSVGPFVSFDEAAAHARTGGYEVTMLDSAIPSPPDLVERVARALQDFADDNNSVPHSPGVSDYRRKQARAALQAAHPGQAVGLAKQLRFHVEGIVGDIPEALHRTMLSEARQLVAILETGAK